MFARGVLREALVTCSSSNLPIIVVTAGSRV